MQQSSHIGNARREERVLLPALIELRSEQGEDTLTADGLDVSPSGLSVRAAFVPEVGTRLYCQFRCPPHDDAVAVFGEVVWSAWDGPRSGSFGIRFLELDTKSATAIRRYVAPDGAQPEPTPEPLPRSATMRIDGLAAPIDADVMLLEPDCIVLEQELSFLRLGRGIEVDVPGRGKERGRIASIELRQGPLDTPTLVFGVLLEAKQAATGQVPVAVRAAVKDRLFDAGDQQLDASLFHSVDHPFGMAGAAGSGALEDTIAAVDSLAPCNLAAEPLHEPTSALVPVPSLEPSVAARAVKQRRSADEPRVVKSPVVGAEPAQSAARDELSDEERALQNRVPESLIWLRNTLAALFMLLRSKLLPLLRGWLGRAGDQVRSEGPSLMSRLGVQISRVKLLFATQWSRFRQRRKESKRRTTSPSPRVQKPAVAVRVQRPDSVPSPRNRRLLTATLALVGVGLGVYALAPRSGADRIRVQKRERFVEEPAVAAPVVSPVAAQPAVESQPVVSEAAAAPTVEPSEPAQGAGPRFGADEVPNGRSFVLRMSGPVQSVEGETREDGFTVRIPGRLALDRASPIATSHRAVARALILNRGEYAELTVEFLPGMRPKYQVLGKGNTIEVTLERL